MDNSKIDIGTLHSIIKLEIQKGYTNTAVVGGINLFIDKWANEVKGKIKSAQQKKHFNKMILYIVMIVGLLFIILFLILILL